jgi:hypothetical protein
MHGHGLVSHDSTEAVAILSVLLKTLVTAHHHKLLTLDTRKIIYRSRIRVASEDPNLRVEPNCVSDTPEVLKTKNTDSLETMATLDTDKLFGRSYLKPGRTKMGSFGPPTSA